jgi:hypothetical protein
MAIGAVVRETFSGYPRGTVLTNAEQVRELRAGPFASHLIPIGLPPEEDPPAPPPPVQES